MIKAHLYPLCRISDTSADCTSIARNDRRKIYNVTSHVQVVNLKAVSFYIFSLTQIIVSINNKENPSPRILLILIIFSITLIFYKTNTFAICYLDLHCKRALARALTYTHTHTHLILFEGT